MADLTGKRVGARNRVAELRENIENALAGLSATGSSSGKATATASPRAITLGTAGFGNTPVITQFDANSGSRPYTPAALTYTTTQVTHPDGVYTSYTMGDGKVVLNNVANGRPGTPLMVTEFMLTGTEAAVWLNSGGTANGTRIMRVIVDGQLAGSVEPTIAGSFYLKLVFPFSATRHVRVETRDVFFRGMNVPDTSAIYPPTVRKPRAALYGDSWVEGGGGGVAVWELTYYLLGVGLGWEMTQMGHGGSGYVTDAVGDSAPMTNATRLARITTLAPDYLIIQGSINDNAATPAAIGAAAATVYSTLAASTPRTKIIVVGPQPVASNGFSPSAAMLANRDAVKAAALDAPNVVLWLDPLENGGWVTDEDLYVSDLTHLTAAGHAAWTERLITELVRA